MARYNRTRIAAAFASLVTLGSCGTPEPEPPTPLFPADALDSWAEARDCRHSHEHELRYIRVLADSAAWPIYSAMKGAYPVGATLVKLEYDDEKCATLVGFTAMQKLAAAEAPTLGDWAWQRLDADRNVVPSTASTCVACHKHHCQETDGTGLDLSCAEEK